MNICHHFVNFVDPFLSMAVSSPRKWMCFLMFLGCGWVFATSFTALGMCMVSCRRMYGSRKDRDESYICQLARDKDLTHAILMLSGAINGLLVVILIFAIIYRKVAYVTREHPPPDYETLIKSETPPPSYNELSFDNPLTCLPEAIFADSEGLPPDAEHAENPNDVVPPFVLLPVNANPSLLTPSVGVRWSDMPPTYSASTSSVVIPKGVSSKPTLAPTEVIPSSVLASADSIPTSVSGPVSTPGLHSVTFESLLPGSSREDDGGAEGVINAVLPVKT